MHLYFDIVNVLNDRDWSTVVLCRWPCRKRFTRLQNTERKKSSRRPTALTRPTSPALWPERQRRA